MAARAGGPIRVLLVDDQQVVLQGLRSIIQETDDLCVVGETHDAAGAHQLTREMHPAVALIDINLGDRTGLNILRSLRREYPDVACIALTSSFDDDLLHDAFAAGISGYLLTQSGCVDLVDAVRHVASGGAVLDPAVTRRLVDMLRERPIVPPEVEGLNARKRRLLKLVAEDHTTAQIAEAVFVSEKTVRNQLSLLVQELGLSSRAELTSLAKSLNRPSLRWCALI
ncbi:MAG: response regulator [Acidimicrobiales bacterium]